MTKEKLWKLRQEIVLGSGYASDYLNDMGYAPEDTIDFFERYGEYLLDKANENGTAADNAIDDYDNADSLWDYWQIDPQPLKKSSYNPDDYRKTGTEHASDREHAMSGFGEGKGTDDTPYWRKAMMLNDIISCSNDEGAYGSWIYVWPDEESEEQAKQDFGTEEDYRELEDYFKDVYRDYHDAGLYNAPEDVVAAAHAWDAKLGLKPIKVIGKVNGGIGESDETKRDMDRISRKHDMREGLKGNESDSDIMDILGIDEKNRCLSEYTGMIPQYRELRRRFPNSEIWMKGDVGPYTDGGKVVGTTADLAAIDESVKCEGRKKAKTGSGGKPMKESDDYGVLAHKYWEREVEYQMDYLSDYGEDKMKDAIGKLSPDDRQEIIASEASGILENDALWDYVNNEVMDSDLETLILDGKNESLKAKHAVPRLHESDDVTASDAPKCPCEVITALIDDEKEAVDGYDKASMDINGIKDGNSAASLALFAKIKQEELEHIKELQGLLDAAKAVNGKADDALGKPSVEDAEDDKKIADAFDDEPVFDDGNDANQLKPVMPAADADITVDADAKKDESRKAASKGAAMTESLKGGDAKHTAHVMLRNSRKPINESCTITRTMSLEEFQPWSGAVDTMTKIIDAGKLDDLDFMLEDQYPEGIDETALNDLLWFDSDWVLDQLGLGEEDTASDEEEPEAKHDDGGTVKTEGFHAGRHHARVLLAHSHKPMNESATITKIMSLEEFQPWSGAVDTMDKIINANKLDDLDFLLEDQYPDGIDETELNDLLWFESDWVLDQLGLKEDDVEPDDDEPEEETEPEDGVAKDDTEVEDYSDVCRNAGK